MLGEVTVLSMTVHDSGLEGLIHTVAHLHDGPVVDPGRRDDLDFEESQVGRLAGGLGLRRRRRRTHCCGARG